MYKKIININNNCYLIGYIIEISNQKKRNTDQWHNSQNPAVLILPGGGYNRIEDCESDPVAFSFLQAGYTCFILNYSCGDLSKYPQPILEIFQSILYIKDNAKKYNINKNQIICCGFSAGGHLAALSMCKSTIESLGYMTKDIRVNSLILGYPLIDIDDFYEKHPNKYGKFGKMISNKDDFNKLNVSQRIEKSYPPTFIWNTFQDDLIDCEQSLKIVNSLIKHNVLVEYHLFTSGVHGLSLNNNLTNKNNVLNHGKYAVNVNEWFDLSISWLDSILNKG